MAPLKPQLKPQLRVRVKRRVQGLCHVSAGSQGYGDRGLGRYIERLIIEDAKQHFGEEFVRNYLENDPERNDTAA